MRMAFTCALSAIVFFFSTTSSSEASPGDHPQWFGDFGVGLIGGVSLKSVPTGERYDLRGALGGEVDLAVLKYRVHQIPIALGFIYSLPNISGGTERVLVTTLYNRLSLVVGYEFCWRILVMGVRVGVSGTIVHSKMIEYEIDYEVAGQSLEYDRRGIERQSYATGISPGLIAGTSIGIDLLRFFGLRGMEFLLQGELEHRSTRQGGFFLGLIRVWPGRIVDSRRR